MMTRMLPLALLSLCLATACGEPDTEDTNPEGDTDTDTDADGDADADADADSDADADTAFFDFRDDHYPLEEGKGTMNCLPHNSEPLYVIGGVGMADSDGVQAQIYTDFPGTEPPAAGTYSVIPYNGGAPAEGEVFIMVMDTTDYSFWWGQEGSVDLSWDGDVVTAQYSGIPAANQAAPTDTTSISAHIYCVPE
jgi:hypothetical protein